MIKTVTVQRMKMGVFQHESCDNNITCAFSSVLFFSVLTFSSCVLPESAVWKAPERKRESSRCLWMLAVGILFCQGDSLFCQQQPSSARCAPCGNLRASFGYRRL